MPTVGNPTRAADQPTRQQSHYELEQRRLTARWLKEHHRPYTGEYLERVLASMEKQIEATPDWGFYYLDMEPA